MAKADVNFNNAAAMYSHGVHGYFSGDLSRADIYLNRAIELNPRDPRPYYFRGLALQRLGRSWEADDMMQQGAAVEASANAGPYGIGEALRRVQGSDRLRLEQFRRIAKVGQSTIAVDNARRREEIRAQVYAKAQRRPVRLPLDAFVNPVEPNQLATLVVAEEPGSESAEPAAPPAVEAIVAPSVEAAADEGDPFADDPLPPPSTEIPTPEAAAAVPEPVSGSVKAGRLPGIFGRILTRQLPSVDVNRLRGMVPGGGAAPPETIEDFGGEAPAGTDPFSDPIVPSDSSEPPTEFPGPPTAEDGENPF